MKYYAVQLYKEIGDGDCIEKGLLKDEFDTPVIFEMVEDAANTAKIVVKTLNDNTVTTWGFRLVEGKTL